MTFNEILTILRDSEINEKVKFRHGGLCGYVAKEDLGEFVYYNDISYAYLVKEDLGYYEKHGKPTIHREFNFFLSDFDRDDWEIIK